MMNENPTFLLIVAILSAAIYFLGWLISEYISYRKLLKKESKIQNHLQDYPLSDYDGIDFLGDPEDYDELDELLDEYYHHDEDYYRTHSAFVIIEKDENESINQ